MGPVGPGGFGQNRFGLKNGNFNSWQIGHNSQQIGQTVLKIGQNINQSIIFLWVICLTLLLVAQALSDFLPIGQNMFSRTKEDVFYVLYIV